MEGWRYSVSFHCLVAADAACAVVAVAHAERVVAAGAAVVGRPAVGHVVAALKDSVPLKHEY